MSAPRTVRVRTQDFGLITIDEPNWCTGRHPFEGWRADVTHRGPEVPLTLASPPFGPRQFLTAYLLQQPFSDTQPGVAIAFGGVETLEFNSEDFRDVIDALIIYALGHLTPLARELWKLEDGGES